MNKLNSEFRRVIEKIEDTKITSSPRGLLVKESFMETLEIDPSYSIPDFKARPFNWKYFLGELSWYLQRDTKIDFINNFSNFWQRIANSEGYINSNYGFILFGDQLEWAKRMLIEDKETRKAVCFLNQPKYQYDDNKDFVCTMYIKFWIRNDKLNMLVRMRSNDMFYGLYYDAPFFSFLQHTMFLWLKDTYSNLSLGSYYHSADNVHYYEKHFEKAKEILNESTESSNTYFLLKEPLFICKNSQYIILEKGQRLLSDVYEMLERNKLDPEFKITNSRCKTILSKYFFITNQ